MNNEVDFLSKHMEYSDPLLCSFLMHTDNNKVMFGSSGGIVVLLDTCKHHMNNAAVMQQACGAMGNACVIKGIDVCIISKEDIALLQGLCRQ